MDIYDLKFDKDGLIPTIVADSKTNEVLMLAYMNEESLKVSIAEGKTCFWSRSRKELWRKGATSGNVQHIVSIRTDCDQDTLLVTVDAMGPACHKGDISCFVNDIMPKSATAVSSDISSNPFTLNTLQGIISDRKANPKPGSYTNYLFEKGKDKILKKIGEEATEVVIAGKSNDKTETIFEISDLAYHLLVLMSEMNISTEDIISELNSRFNKK